MNKPIKILRVENCNTPGILEFYNSKHCKFTLDNNDVYYGIIIPEYTFDDYNIFVMQIYKTTNRHIDLQPQNCHFIFGKYPKKESFIAINDFIVKNFANARNEIVYTAYKSDKLKALCYIISKCGCSTIVNTFIKNDVNPNSPMNKLPWGKREKFQCKANVIDIETTTKYDDYIKFMVIRNPIDRFISMCNYTIKLSGYLGQYINTNYSDIKNIDKSIYIDLMIQLAKMNKCVYNNKLRDQHLSPQYDEIKSITKLDYVVLLPDLQKFFLDKFNVPAEKCNENGVNLISKNDLTDDHIKKIKDIYYEDFVVLEQVELYK